MREHLETALEYARQHEAAFLASLQEFVAFGSIST